MASLRMASVTETLLLTAAAALFAAHMLMAVCNAFSAEWRRETRKSLAKVQQCFVPLSLWRRDPTDELSREVTARMRERQLRNSRSILAGLKWFYCIGCVIHIINIDRATFASLQQDVLLMTLYATALLAEWCLWLVTQRSMDIWYSCNLVLWNLYILPVWCTYSVMDISSVFIRMAIAFINPARLHIPIAIFRAVVRMLCTFWAVGFSEHGFSGEGSSVLRHEVIFMVGMILLVCVFAENMEADCRRDAEELAMEEKQTAADALLEMSYDVVVELDHDFSIAKPTPRLSSFLLRPSTPALQHVPFEDLLFEEADRVLFRSQVGAPLGTASSRVLLQLQMRDANGTAVAVELFCFRSHRLGTPPRCTLGLRESGDPALHNRLAPQGRQPISGEDQVCELEEVSAVVDTMNAELPILDCSHVFAVRIMPMTRGCCFSPALVNRDRFVDWLQMVAQAQWYSGENGDDIEGQGRSPESLSLEFRPRGRTYMRALCSTALVEEDSSSDEETMPENLRVRLQS